MGGILALALAVGLALPWNWRLPLLGGGVLAAALMAATQWENLLSFKARRSAGSRENGRIGPSWRPINDGGSPGNMFLDRPLWGCGYSQYKTEPRNYLSDPLDRSAVGTHADYIPHNVVLSLLTETGLVGGWDCSCDGLLLDSRRLAAVVRCGFAAFGPGSRVY